VIRAARGLLVPLLIVALGGLVGCDSAAPSIDQGGVEESPVQVDTPQLRVQKAEADIAPCPKAEGQPATSGGLPDIDLPCLGGGRDVNLARLTGTPTVVNFWAQSCGPCREESPVIEKVYRSSSGRVQVLGVDWQDTEPGAAIAFAAELGLTYPQLADPTGETRAALSMVGLPMTVFLDASGQIIHVESGPILSVDDLQQLISEHLGVDLSKSGA
jgi:cytochrome c biogenesis protein CcmG/thiol:disulfide interchange protein DsbE